MGKCVSRNVPYIYIYIYLWNTHDVTSVWNGTFRPTPSPRWQRSYLQGYSFSGMYYPATEPFPDAMAPILDWVNGLGIGCFNQMWVNWYQNGHHYIARHQDNEPRLIPDSPIVSVNFGATRTLRFREVPVCAVFVAFFSLNAPFFFFRFNHSSHRRVASSLMFPSKTIRC